MLDAILENRILAAAVVVVVVPLVLIGYILLIEAILRQVPRRWARGLRPWLWLAPALTFLGVFLVYPTIATIIRSFQNRRGNAFVGLDNYQWFFSQDDTLIALRNNVLWVILLPLLVVALGLLVAVLVDRVRYESTVKSVVFLPLAISFVAAARDLEVHVRPRPERRDVECGRDRRGRRPRRVAAGPALEQLLPHRRRRLAADRVRDGHPVGRTQGHQHRAAGGRAGGRRERGAGLPADHPAAAGADHRRGRHDDHHLCPQDLRRRLHDDQRQLQHERHREPHVPAAVQQRPAAAGPRRSP